MKRHWLHIFHTLKYLVDLYEDSLKVKIKNIEMNFSDSNGTEDITHLDLSDFFKDPSSKINHLIGNEHVFYN